MFDNIFKFFKKIGKKEPVELTSKDMAKERLHLVLMQDRANVSADFLDMMKQEIIEVIKKYIDVNENEIDVRLTNKMNEDGTVGAPALYANIPIAGVKSELQNATNDNKVERDEKQEEKKLNDELKIEEVSKETKKEENKDKDKDKNKEESSKNQKVKEEEKKELEKDSEESVESVEDKKEDTSKLEESPKDNIADKKDEKPDANE